MRKEIQRHYVFISYNNMNSYNHICKTYVFNEAKKVNNIKNILYFINFLDYLNNTLSNLDF